MSDTDNTLDPSAADRLPAVAENRVNIPLLRKAIEWATAEATKPEAESEWYQAAYRLPAHQRSEEMGTPCGTAYCIAGYTCHVAGLNWANNRDTYLLADGRQVSSVAQELLGITPSEATSLFSGYNDIEAVQAAASEIAARAGERL